MADQLHPGFASNDVVKLIPRVHGWVNSNYYSGTPVALTEYNWGAEGHINGATAQADLLGIFGRYGLSIATRWTVPAASTPTFKAMQMYRNYDGKHGTFGDTSVFAQGSNLNQLAVFAAQRALDGALTVMAVNKVLSGDTLVTFKLQNFASAGSASVYQLTSANKITHLANVTWSASNFSKTLPPQSITLFVLPK